MLWRQAREKKRIRIESHYIGMITRTIATESVLKPLLLKLLLKIEFVEHYTNICLLVVFIGRFNLVSA